MYKYIKMLKNPYIIELGRYKGGTTFLMAAAGGRVVSLDNGAIADQEYFTNELKRALSKFNFLHRAEIVIADALKYEIKPETYDLVFLDCAYNFAYAKKFFDLWWNAVKTGGIFIFRDGKDTVLKDVARFVETIDGKIFGAEIDNDLPGSFVLCRKLDKFYFSS